MGRVRAFLGMLLIAAGAGWVSAADEPLDAAMILEQVRAGWRGESFHALVEIEITVSGTTRRHLVEVWTCGEDRALIRIVEPEAEAGSGYLQLGDALWYYSPALGTAIALPAMGLTQALFGAGPSLGDLAQGTLSRDHDVQAEAVTGADGALVGYLLTLLPRLGAPVVYGKLEVTVTADYVLSKIVYYDQRGAVLRTAAFEEVVRIGEILFPTKVVVVDANGDRAVQQILDPEFGIALDPSFFTVERLEAGE
ncbi:MAG: hypothetical protein Kow0097_07410 [Candidatus Bipolaricaulota bacterium]